MPPTGRSLPIFSGTFQWSERKTGALFSQTEKGSPMVGKTCSKGNLGFDLGRGTPLFSTSRLSGVQESKEISPRSGSGFGSTFRVHGSGGSHQGPPKNNKEFSAMFCHQQTGERQRKTQVNIRLSDDQSVFRSKIFQVRPLEEHLPLFEEGHVGRQNRTEA